MTGNSMTRYVHQTAINYRYFRTLTNIKERLSSTSQLSFENRAIAVKMRLATQAIQADLCWWIRVAEWD